MCIAGVSEVSESMKCHAGHYCPLGTTIQVSLKVNDRLSLGKVSDTMSFCSYFSFRLRIVAVALFVYFNWSDL